MKQEFSLTKYSNLRFLIGDVRDKDRLNLATKDIDYDIYAVALKQVPSAEYNLMKFVKINVQDHTYKFSKFIKNKLQFVL